MTQVDGVKALGKNEFYRCPFPHVHPRHKQAFFKDFDAHFRIFGDREDHFAVVQLHEELAWNMRHSASEKGKLGKEDLRRISLAAWLDAVKRSAGKPIQVVSKKQKRFIALPQRFVFLAPSA
jgi:hypothetical protein